MVFIFWQSMFKIIFRYSPPQVCRKLKIQDIVKKYRRERSVSDFYVSLFFSFFYQWCKLKYTWIYENRVSKNFCNFSQLPLSNSLFTVLFAYVVLFFFFLLVLWLGICVEVDVDRIAILAPPLPPYFSLTTILYLTQVIVIWNQCAPKAVYDKRRLQTCRPQASRPADFQTRKTGTLGHLQTYIFCDFNRSCEFLSSCVPEARSVFNLPPEWMKVSRFPPCGLHGSSCLTVTSSSRQ